MDDEFQRLTRTARFREGEGLNGRSWRLRDLFHVGDVGELHDCSRAPLARRAGIRAAVALPVMRDGQVVGTLDFFSTEAVEISPERLAALRMIGRLSSDKFSKLARQGELVRIQQMVENAPVNIMYADRDLKLLYMNTTAIRTFKKLEHLLPVKVEQMVGQSLDIFHKDPAHQRRLLADPRNLPYSATIRVGPEYLELSASAILDQNGEYLGPMVTWEHVDREDTRPSSGRPRSRPTPRAVNQLLLGLTRARTVRDVITTALTSVREAFGWSTARSGRSTPGPGAAVRPGLGLGRATSSAG